MPRPVINAPGGLAQVRVAGGGISGFARVSPVRVQGNELVDFSGLANAINSDMHERAEKKAQDEIGRGQRFATENAALADQIDAEIQKASKEAKARGEEFDVINESFARLSATGAVPEAANPIWQLGYTEKRAEAMARSVRDALLEPDFVNTFTALYDEGDPATPPDLDAAMAQAFSERISGTAMAQSEFGMRAFSAAQEGIQNEVRERVRQQRLTAITADGRRLFRDSVGRQVMALELQDFDKVQENADELSRILQEEGAERGISPAESRQEFLRVLEDSVNALALEDPGRAAELAERAGRVQQGGVRMDDPGTESALKIQDLTHRMRLAAEDKRVRKINLRHSTSGAIQEFASGYVRSSAFKAVEAGQDPSAAIDIALRRIMGQDPDVPTPTVLTGLIMELEEGEEIPADIRGLLLQDAQRAKDAFNRDALNPDREAKFLNDLQIARESGSMSRDEFLKRLWDDGVLTGAVSFDAYKAQEEATNELRLLMKFKSEAGSNYSTSVAAALSADRIPPGIPTGVRQELANAQLDSFRDADAALQELIEGSPDEETARRAFNSGTGSAAIRELIKRTNQAIAEAQKTHDTSVREITALTNASDFAGAQKALDDARGVTISGVSAGELQKSLTTARNRQGDLLTKGQAARDAEITIRSTVEALQGAEAEASGEEFDPIAAGEAQEEAVAAGRKAFQDKARELFSDPTIPQEEKAAAALQAAQEAAREAISDFAGTEAKRDRAAERRVKGRLRADQVFSGGTDKISRSTFFAPLHRSLNIADTVYAKVEDIGKAPWGVTKAQNRYRILEEWDRNVFAQEDPAKRADAFIATHGQYRIPFQAVIKGNVAIDTLAGADKWGKSFPDLDTFAMTGRAARRGEKTGLRLYHATNKGELQAFFEARGLEVEFVPDSVKLGATRDFDAKTVKGLAIRVKSSIDLNQAPLSPWVTRYFDDVSEWDSFNAADQKAALERFGFPVGTPEELESSTALFLDGQQKTINDWKSRE